MDCIIDNKFLTTEENDKMYIINFKPNSTNSFNVCSKIIQILPVKTLEKICSNNISIKITKHNKSVKKFTDRLHLVRNLNSIADILESNESTTYYNLVFSTLDTHVQEKNFIDILEKINYLNINNYLLIIKALKDLRLFSGIENLKFSNRSTHKLSLREGIIDLSIIDKSVNLTLSVNQCNSDYFLKISKSNIYTIEIGLEGQDYTIRTFGKIRGFGELVTLLDYNVPRGILTVYTGKIREVEIKKDRCEFIINKSELNPYSIYNLLLENKYL